MRWTISKAVAFVFAVLLDIFGAWLLFSPEGFPMIGFMFVVFGSVVIAVALLDGD